MSLIASRASGTTVIDLVTLGPVQAPRQGLVGCGGSVGMACSARAAGEPRARVHSKRTGAPQAGAVTHHR